MAGILFDLILIMHVCVFFWLAQPNKIVQQ